MKTSVEILTEARTLVAREDGWIQNNFQKECSGQMCYCSVGAVDKAANSNVDFSSFDRALRFLYEVTGAEVLSQWNDKPERTQAEVVAAFDKAIELAKEAE